MSMFFYYVSHTFVNSIKKLFKSWVVIVLVIAFVFGISVGVGASLIDDSLEDSANDTVTQETITEEDDEPENAEDIKDYVLPIVEMAVFGVFFATVFINLYTSDKSGNSIFNMADVNFLFPSPMRPQAVLFFKTVLQALIITVACTIYLAFQLPNLVLNAGLSLSGAVALIVAFVISILFGKMISVLSYTAAASKIGGKKKILPICIGIIAALIAVFFTVKSLNSATYFETAKLLFASKYSRFFPLFGWLAGATISIFEGKYIAAALYYLALAGGFAVLLFIISKTKADFYEDALAGAQKNQEKIDAALEGKNQKAKKHKKDIKETEIGRGKGASIFYTRTLYVRRREGLIGSLTKMTVTYLLIALALSLFGKYVIESNTLAVFGFVLLIIEFFRNFSSPIETDLQTPWLRLVPEGKYKKIFFSLAGGVTGAVLDTVPAFVVAAILLDNSAEMLLWFAVFVTYEFFISACALSADAIIPDTLHPSIKKMFCVYFRMFMVVPGAILLGLGLASGSFTVFAIITALLNIALATGFFFLGAGVTNA